MGLYSIVQLDEGIVDGDDFDVVVLDRIAEDDAPDTTEPVDADFRDHFGGVLAELLVIDM